MSLLYVNLFMLLCILEREDMQREALPEADILKREPAPALELHEATSILVRDEDVEPDILNDPDDGLWARICRYGCL